MADYWTHWYAMGDKLGAHAPAVFYVNWVRTARDGRWLWPGFGENSRVLKWICERIEGAGQAVETPIGNLPAPGALDMSGLNVSGADLAELLAVDIEGWKREAAGVAENYKKFGSHLPPALEKALDHLSARLSADALPQEER
jgi:phosphoenolpyruvate carboxykinase (GTP)